MPDDTEFGIVGSENIEVSNFSFDSRNITEGVAFVARKGSVLDGHAFIQPAIENGCRLIISERLPEELNSKVTYVYSDKLPELLAKVLNAFYDEFLSEIKLIGVTGTNGKTTVASLLFELYTLLGYSCGLLSTVENKTINEVWPSTHTTPDQISLYELLYKMYKRKCSHIFMEVSSHAIDQQRITGLNFTAGVFTNITHDHLDYHKTFDHYLMTKKKLFDRMNSDSYAIINWDDQNAGVMVQNSDAKIVKYAVKGLADYKARILGNGLDGLHLRFNGNEWHSKLMGEFNASNLLAVYSVACSMGEDPVNVLEKMSLLKAVHGRFEFVTKQGSGKLGVVDYAHTPDALKKILINIRNIKVEDQNIICVVGCGGDRDKSKRPIMAKIACELSSMVILTSDNPRNEDPNSILEEMEKGVELSFEGRYIKIEDREQAIKTACIMAQPKDIVVIAGKGHETYQEIKGKKFPFDDKMFLQLYL